MTINFESFLVWMQWLNRSTTIIKSATICYLWILILNFDNETDGFVSHESWHTTTNIILMNKFFGARVGPPITGKYYIWKISVHNVFYLMELHLLHAIIKNLEPSIGHVNPRYVTIAAGSDYFNKGTWFFELILFFVCHFNSQCSYCF